MLRRLLDLLELMGLEMIVETETRRTSSNWTVYQYHFIFLFIYWCLSVAFGQTNVVIEIFYYYEAKQNV